MSLFLFTIALLQLVNMIIAGKRLMPDTLKLVVMYRTKVNPPYPLTSSELLEKIGPTKMNTPLAIPDLFRTFFNQLRLIFSSHDAYPEIAKLAHKVRTEIYRFLIMTVVIVLLILAVGTFGVVIDR